MRSQRGHLLQVATGCSASSSGSISRRRSTAMSTGQLPLASTRILRPRPDRFPDREHLRHVTVHAHLQLEGLEATGGPVAGIFCHRFRIARSQGRVASHRPRRGRPQQPPDRHVGQLADQVEQRHLHRVASLRREFRHAPHVVLRVSGELLAHQLRAPQRIQLLHDQRQGRPPAQDQWRCLAESLGPFGAESQQGELALLQPAAGGHVRLAETQRKRHHLERLDARSGPGHERRRPAESNRENSASSAPQRASAPFREGPSVREETVRTARAREALPAGPAAAPAAHRSRQAPPRSRTAASR